MMARCISMVVSYIAMALLAPSGANAGSISGVVQELTGSPIVGARITVIDLATGQIVGSPAQSAGGGAFRVNLPNGAAVSVTFADGGIHLPASLIGISGNTVLNNFPIFMPVPRNAQTQCNFNTNYYKPLYYYAPQSHVLWRRYRH